MPQPTETCKLEPEPITENRNPTTWKLRLEYQGLKTSESKQETGNYKYEMVNLKL